MTILVWFRQDLRVPDNAALASAASRGEPVIPVYIHAPDEEDPWGMGGAARCWLHESLSRLRERLDSLGSSLCLRAGTDSLAALKTLCRESGARAVVWNRRYEPAVIARDQRIKADLRAAGIEADSYNSALLNEPWSIRTKSGGPFQVFTAYWRCCKSLGEPADAVPAPRSLQAPASWPDSQSLESLELLPKALRWADGLRAAWTPGSEAAHAQLERFLEQHFDHYEDARDRPGDEGTSRLSPHLHFGEIGPREIWQATRRAALERGRRRPWRDSQFLTEIGWREFAHHLLYHFPNTPSAPLRPAYARFPWKADAAWLRAWQRGRTGYPIVDAGMRQLWNTGWMHNRVRMIAGSFLVKDLLQPWVEGARWFWDTLVDADLASNTLGWQWVAGCGADAAPFFRIFNPVSQAMRFDPDGAYVRRWVPELGGLPNEWLHKPWDAPPAILRQAGVLLGSTYPHRIVDHALAREQALAAFARVKSGNDDAS